MMFEKVKAAQLRIQDYAHRTPVLTSRTLNEFAGADVLLKCENFQRVGAFKFRGAFNAISQLSDDERARGVLTYSSGNHAQGVALAAKLLDMPAVIVMPAEGVRAPIPVSANGLRGTIVPVGQGSMAVVGADGEALDALVQRLRTGLVVET